MRQLFLILTLLLLPVGAFAAQGSMVQYDVGGKTYEGYWTSPEADAPFILLIHDWDGLTDYEVKRADMLASLGYAVFAADLFGAGIRPTEIKDKRQHTGELYKDRGKMRALMLGALEKARSLGADPDRTVAMGYCFGGSAVLELARSGTPMMAFATFHGGLETPEGQDYSKTKGQVLIFHGTADAYISMDQFADLAKSLESAGVRHEMTTYSGAPHAFTVYGAPSYRRIADQRSWQRFTTFLHQLFAGK